MGACSAKLELPSGYSVDLSTDEGLSDLSFRLSNRQQYKKKDRAKLDRLASAVIGGLTEKPKEKIYGRSEQQRQLEQA